MSYYIFYCTRFRTRLSQFAPLHTAGAILIRNARLTQSATIQGHHDHQTLARPFFGRSKGKDETDKNEGNTHRRVLALRWESFDGGLRFVPLTVHGRELCRRFTILLDDVSAAITPL